MFNVRKFGVAAMMMLSAASAMASNFRGADQVYLPAAGRIPGASGTFISDVWISNLSDQPVTVTVVYATTPGGTQQKNFNPIQLAARERREFVDFFQSALGLDSGFGQLIFNACLQGADCVGTQDPNGISPNYRNIAVSSRIYSIPPGTTLAQNPPTTGQFFAGVPWYHFVSSDQTSNGLGRVFITGLRNTGAAPQAGTYRGNVGMVNASEFSSTQIVVKLFTGTGTQVGSEYVETLQPLGHTQRNLGAMFPSFTGSTATNHYITVEQRNSTPTADAAANGCQQGCPAFFAYASVLDNASGDATTLEANYEKPLTDTQIACIYNPAGASCKNATSLRRASRH